MTRIDIVTACIAACLAAGLAGCGQSPAPGSRAVPQAQEITRATFQEFGDHVVHFNAQSTTMLPPEVARAYGIQRSANRAMLNVAVQRKLPEGGSTPVSAAVSVDATNLLGQQKDVRIRELRDADAIYYIGEVTVANEEILSFTISVRPEGADAPYEVRFRQQFYTN
jgi:hypothetical protein